MYLIFKRNTSDSGPLLGHLALLLKCQRTVSSGYFFEILLENCAYLSVLPLMKLK
jgi:hypothetical protein